MLKNNIFDCLILGGGPAGLSSALYCARANLKCALVDISAIGGTLINYLEIENYLGFDKINTVDLCDKFENHVDNFNVQKYPYCEIEKLDLQSPIKKIQMKDKTFLSKSIIIASGAKARKLNVKGEDECVSRGVSYCSVCDGNFYKDKVVSVIGGGNTALESAIYLSNIAKKVYLIHRRDSFRADNIIQDRIKRIKNIELIMNSEVIEILHNEKVNGIKLLQEGKERKISLDGVFPCVGLVANSELYSSQLELNQEGFILTDENMKTNLDGVWAVGDIRNTPLRQVITAVSDGAIAGYNASKYVLSLESMKVI